MIDKLLKSGPVANRTRWFDPVNDKTFQADAVTSTLRDLAHRAVAFHYEQGESLRLTQREAKVLQPLFGGSEWALKRPQRLLGFLDSVLYFTGKDADFSANRMVLAVGATAEKRFLGRRSIRKRAKGAALIGGEDLIPVLLNVAWSSPALQMHVLAAVRKSWRERTLFYPEDIDWPDRVSIEVVLILFLLALARPREEQKPRLVVRFFLALRMRPVRRMERLLRSWLQPALAKLGPQVDVEHLIVVDAIARLQNGLLYESVSGFCAGSPLAGVFGWHQPDVMAQDEREQEHAATEGAVEGDTGDASGGVEASLAHESSDGDEGNEAQQSLDSFAVSEDEKAVFALGERLALRLL